MITGTDATVVVALIAASGAIGGAMMQFVSTRWQSRDSDRKNDRDDFSTITSALRIELANEQQEKKDLEKKVEGLLVRVSVLEGKMAAAPFPEWMVGLDGTYLWVNTSFESRWLRGKGIDRTAIVGMTHASIFSEQAVVAFSSIDMVARTRANFTARQDNVELDNDPVKWLIVKWGIRDLQTGALIGFHGAAIPSDF